MGKGYKRKTRWRTLNIADCPSAPPSNQDDENVIRKTRENGTRSNGQGGHKSSVHSRNENGITTGDSTGVLPSRSQPKFIFDENEYTRITTPRQDVLFKKGYLARKRVWSGNNASTSATPSTTESQSASHSTADGSETTEDQQLLDYRENGVENYPQPADSVAQMSYGTFYDHASGYYYEYPMMLMGPPMPGPPMHNVLAAMPCQAVPLRPIEWVNPAFVPELDQQYCYIDYSMDPQYPVTVNEKEETVPIENTNGTEEIVENGNGSTGWTDSVASEEQTLNDDDHQNQRDKDVLEETQDNDNYEVAAVDGNFTNEPSLETVLAQQLHVSHHVLPPVPQPYMYPGHYMFGPALMNVNGMTIQSGQMMRANEINATTSAFARSRKKKKMRHKKQRRPFGPENIGGYGPEEEDYSSEAENAKLQTSVNGASVFVPNSTITSSRPLNPNCKEFEFKTNNIESQSNTSLTDSIITTTTVPIAAVENNINDLQSSEINLLNNGEVSYNKLSSSIHDINELPTVSSTIVTNIEYATEAISNEVGHTNGFCEIQETEIGVDVTCPEFNDIVDKLEENCAKLSIQNNIAETIIVTEYDPLSNGTNESCDKNEIKKLANHENLSKNNAPKNKYKGGGSGGGGGVKLIRESTPGPRLDQHPSTSDTDVETHVNGVPMGVDAIEAQINADKLNEDSGFESQTRFSDHPITDAVTQWLRRANSPELFITAMNGGNRIADSDMEDDELEDGGELSKNLQGNPMPALSVNSIVNDVEIMSSRTASCGEFTTGVNDSLGNNAVTTIRKKKKRSGNSKKRMTKNNNSNVEMIGKKIEDNDKLNCRQQRKKNRTAAKLHAKSIIEQQNVVCEFTAKDSDAGMRVAATTRINLNEVMLIKNNDTNERMIKSSRDAAINTVEMDIDKVKTFEQGQIVVSIDGKLLPNTIYGIMRSSCEQDKFEEQLVNVSDKNLIDSIEEPDMLECWEAEIVESSSKQLMKDGENYQNYDMSDDINCTKVDISSLELVRKYYKLARESVESFSSIENGVNDADQLDAQYQTKLLNQQFIDTLCNNNKTSSVTIEPNNILNKRLPIDDGIEIYESCYTGQRPPIYITPNLYKSHLLRDEDGPIPCKAVCCMIQ